MIPNQNDLVLISKSILENYKGKDFSNMEITFYVGKDDINKINEDFYIRNYGTEPPENDLDEVNVNIYNIHYKYKIKND